MTKFKLPVKYFLHLVPLWRFIAEDSGQANPDSEGNLLVQNADGEAR
jgi:hypothetical protein